MKKHAFLIMAHNSIIDLITCCKSIDDVNHNIYIHIDKKWQSFNEKELLKEIHSSKVFLLRNRLSVMWGGGIHKLKSK